MRFSSFTPALVASSLSLVLGAPVEDNQAVAKDFNPPPGGDTTILNYALTLEYLEREFYREGLSRFSSADFASAGFPDPFYDNLKEIYSDEETHVSFLANALGAAAVKQASYKFPFTSAASFVALSSVLEGVGVSAYLGAAAAIANKNYLTVAGSILTVESRHSAYIRARLRQSPFPKAFDTPLDFNQVYSLAAQFITSFAPGAAPLPFKAFPPLAVQASQSPYTAGVSSITFTNAKKNALAEGLMKPDTPVYAVFFSGLDKYYAPVYSQGGDFKIDRIPAGGKGMLAPSGQVYVVLNTNCTMVTDENTISGVGVIEVNLPQ